MSNELKSFGYLRENSTIGAEVLTDKLLQFNQLVGRKPGDFQKDGFSLTLKKLNLISD